MTRNRAFFGSTIVPLLFGCMALAAVMTRPRFAAYRGVDVITLVAAGMCLGVGLMSLMMRRWKGSE